MEIAQASQEKAALETRKSIATVESGQTVDCNVSVDQCFNVSVDQCFNVSVVISLVFRVFRNSIVAALAVIRINQIFTGCLKKLFDV